MVDTLSVPVQLGSTREEPQLRPGRRLLEPLGSAAAHEKQLRRQSMRPLVPPKPPPMARSLSDDHQRAASVAERTSSLPPPVPFPPRSGNASHSLGIAHDGESSRTTMEQPRRQEHPVRGEAVRWPHEEGSIPTTTTSANPNGPSAPASLGTPASRLIPSLPPRPLAKSSPLHPSAIVEPPTPSSCPSVLSPFATAAEYENDPVAPLMRPSASRSPDRSRFRTLGGRGANAAGEGSSGSTSGTQPASGGLSSSASYSSLNPSSALSALGRGWQQAKLKDRLGAGVVYAREWGGKGKGKLQDGWRGFGGAGGAGNHRASVTMLGASDPASSGTSSSSASSNSFAFSNSSRTLSSFLSSSSTMPDLAAVGGQHGSPASNTAHVARPGGPSPARGTVKLPALLFAVSVPDRQGVVFGQPLAQVVAATRTPSLVRPASADQVIGDDARYWLPGIAYRCLEYLEEWGMREEGVFRVPGRSSHMAELKAMFDAGVGQEMDLREVHPSDLDPHAVASVFKSWLRELPDSLLSAELEGLVDDLTIQHLGFGASSNNFLASKGAAAAAGTPTGSAGPSPNSSAPPSPNPDPDRLPYLEQLRDLFAMSMPAEHWHLLRAVIFHLARLADNAHVNKMTLNNLRLILSPTLRLSPGFLQLLVVERRLLFSRPNEAAQRRFAPEPYSNAQQPPLPPRPQGDSPRDDSAGRLAPRSIDAGLANDAARARSPVLGADLAPPSPSAIKFSSPASTPTTSRFVASVQEATPVSTERNDRTPMLGSDPVSAGFDAGPLPESLRISPEPPKLERLSLGEEFRDAIEQFDKSVAAKVSSADLAFDSEQEREREQELERLADQTPSRPRTHRKGHSNLSISSMRSFMSSTSLSSNASSYAASSESDLRSARVKHAHTASSSSSFWRRKPPSPATAAVKANRRQSVAYNLSFPVGLGVELPGDKASSRADGEAGLLSMEERRKLFGG